MNKNIPLLMDLIYSGINNPSFQPRDSETFCNQFVQSILNGFGFKRLNGMNANEMVDFMENPVNGFISVNDDVAQSHANEGVIVIAGWKNAEGHGHVNVIVPGLLETSNSFGKTVPKCANVGQDVFMGKKISFAFRPEMAPHYFAVVEMI